MLGNISKLLIATLAITSYAHAENAELAKRIERIENGLLLPVAVRGVPNQTMKLSDRMQALKVPGLSIAVIDHGAIEWARAYGVMDNTSTKPVTTDTLFQVASLSKPVAAVVTMRLAGSEKLSLDDDVNRHLRQWKLPDSALAHSKQ